MRRSARTITAKTIVNTISTRALPQPFPAPIPALRRPHVAGVRARRGTTAAGPRQAEPPRPRSSRARRSARGRAPRPRRGRGSPGASRRRAARAEHERDTASGRVGDPDLRQEAERRVAVLVEDPPQLEQRPQVVVEAGEGEDEEQRRTGHDRGDAALARRPDAASQIPSGQRKNLIAAARPTASRGATARRGTATRAPTSRHRNGVRCETRISPMTEGHIAKAP